MGEFRMPSLGADMDEGTLIEWLVHPGDSVHRGDIVAVVATDKADIEVEIFEAGVIDHLLVPEGETVPVGTPLAVVRAPDDTGPAPQPPPPPPPPPPATEAPPVAAPEPAPEPVTAPEPPEPVTVPERAEPPPPVAATPPVPRPAPDVYAPSPVVRRLARHRGVDLATVTGTGPGGAITRADVEAAAGAPPASRTEAPSPAPSPAPAERPDRAAAMQAALGELMARSKREIPHYYLATDVDFSRARAWLDTTNATRPVTERLVPAALLVKAVALAARDHPEMNGAWVDDAFVPATEVNVGVAVSLRGGGLIAPALVHADEMSLDQLAAALIDLVTRARGGRLRAAEMSGPTITVTNLGDQGVERVFGVIYPPQVAIVGSGRISDRPFARDGMVGVHPVVTLTLSGDHRVSDGHRGSRFLARIDQLLQTPEQL